MRHRSHSCLLAGVLLLVCCVMGDSRLTLDACTTDPRSGLQSCSVRLGITASLQCNRSQSLRLCYRLSEYSSAKSPCWLLH